MRPPTHLHLPSGRLVELEAADAVSPRTRRHAAPLFSEWIDLVESHDLVLREGGRPFDVMGLELRDFHTLRAVATRLGWLDEPPVEIECHNCGAPIGHHPCKNLELGPFEAGELDDPTLDWTLDLSATHAIPAVPLAEGRVAREVRLTTVDLRTAQSLHRALRRRRFAVSPEVVTAMGIAALGPERDARRIAHALARCPEDAWAAIGNLFLEAHYPPRLSSVALCPKCGARNDVDAPYEREFEPFLSAEPSNAQVFPELAQFDACARRLFDRAAGDQFDRVALIVDDGVPACDDGGEPLLGSYVPPGGDPSAPVGLAEVTVYVRSFRTMWTSDGPYDWQAELAETIEHELEHHAGWRRGHDAMDDEEREEIVREHSARVGRKSTRAKDIAALRSDATTFLARTWPIWLIVAVWTVAVSVCGQGGPNPN